MKRGKSILLFSVALISCSILFSQQNFIPSSLSYKNKALPLSFSNPPFTLSNNSPSVIPSISRPFEKGIHYSAFFCKMEVRNCERYNIGIKFHAGEYDKYTRENEAR